MSQEINVGAKRLGDESKIKQRIHGFDRANFDLSRKFRTTMNVGTLIPCYKELVTAGTTIELNEKNDVKTLPTVGPLFGSFKLQTDYFFVPLRLYMSTLHNNQLNIGLQMNKVKLPKLLVENVDTIAAGNYNRDVRKLGVQNSNVLHYLGYKGAIKEQGETPTNEYQYSKLNAVPLLGMYDIFKNYYSNKQEENCYMNTGAFQIMGVIAEAQNEINPEEGGREQIYYNVNYGYRDIGQTTFSRPLKAYSMISLYIFKDEFFTPTEQSVRDNLQTILERVYVDFNTNDGELQKPATTLWELVTSTEYGINDEPPLHVDDIVERPYAPGAIGQLPTINQWEINIGIYENTEKNNEITAISWRRNVTIQPVKLSIFDDIREALLTKPFMQEYSFKWDDNKDFNRLIGRLGKLQNYTSPLEGLMVKTYQSDLLNNWMNTEWLDGDNGINAVTAVDTSSGSFDINSLIVARKTFDMLNRIAMSDGDYKGWQQAVYDHNGKWNIEQPLYIGGYSEEVVFQEVISNSASENEPLGTLAGRGMNINKRGDKIYFKADEAGYIMGMVSLTPRLDYSDGNDFDTYLDNMDDLHKPSLDGIAFQDLNTKQAAWWDGSATEIFSFGKQVAWQNYMTAINQVHGEFALNGDYSWMTLQRKYHARIEEKPFDRFETYIKDRTTYISPNDWNGIFADERDDGQNFWLNKLQMADFRRVMAAKQIPNL